MKAISAILMLTALLGLTACGDDKAKKASDSAQAKTETAASTADLPKPADNDQAVVDALQAKLDKAQVADLTVKSAIKTSMPDIYWVSFENAPAMFTDKNGSYLIQGQIVNLDGEKPTDIVAEIQSKIAVEALSNINPSEMIIIPAKGDKKASITVFTDPTCHFCQKLHEELDLLTAGGIEVRYLAWPRSESAVPLTEQVWCASDRLTALGDAKKGKSLDAKTCDNPVRKHMAIGHQLGVTGTPAVFTESGQQIGGYLPADEMIRTAIAYQ